MSTRTARTPRAPRTSRPSRRPNLMLRLALVAIVLAALAAVVISAAGSGSPGGGDSSAGASKDVPAFDTATVTATGTALPAFPDKGADPAVGQKAPRVQGTDLSGATRVVPTTGRPTILLFLAHWCPHCQREVPVVQDWVQSGGLPEDVDLVGVATAMSDVRPNWPASSWLAREGWTAPTVADAGNQAAVAYGLSGFPYWVVLDADGKVVERRTGELSTEQIDAMVQAARDGAPKE